MGKKIAKIILLIMLIIILVLAIHTIRNYIILGKIVEKQLAIQNSTNYSFIAEGYNEDNDEDKTRTETYRKDEKSITVFDMKGVKIIDWLDRNTRESIYMYPSTMKAEVRNESWDAVALIVSFTERNPFMALISFISTEEVNGEECYLVKYGKRNAEYISKERGVTVKKKGSTEKDSNGIEHKRIVEYKEWKFNEVTDEDVARPNLTGYEIIEK